MKLRVYLIAISVVGILAACHAANPGSASLPTLAQSPFSRAAEPIAEPAGGFTTAWGHLVDDPSGKPLARVAVHLESWKHGCIKTSHRTASCPGYLRWHAATRADGKFVLRDVPNGDYLLVIGSDSSADLIRPTIHDHVTFAGGVQYLRAPTLPRIPCDQNNYVEWCQGVRPSPGVTAYPRPLVEKRGDYRLATIDPKREEPCAVEFNKQRAKRHLPLVVVDEWLTENSREILAYRITNGSNIPQPVPYLVGLGEVGDAGGTGCMEMVEVAFIVARTQAADPRTRWIAGLWYTFSRGKQAGGLTLFPLDVRLNLDREVGPWP